MRKGRIIALKTSFGFIEFEKSGKKEEIFFHETESEDFQGLKIGDVVEFEAEESTKLLGKSKAIKLKKVA